MRSLTRLWFDHRWLKCAKETGQLTHRLFFQKLDDPDRQKPPLYLAVNTLSGAVDVLNQDEGRQLDSAIATGDLSHVSDALFDHLGARGYVFESKELEELVFSAFIQDTKHRGYVKDGILAFFALDTHCPMKCEYCFEKKADDTGQGDPTFYEKAVMNPEAIGRAFAFLDMIRAIQRKEIEFVAGWGGEPLQERRLDVNRCFLESAVAHGIPVAYFSNLALLGEGLMALLKAHSAHIRFIQTTLDDLGPAHDRIRQLPGAYSTTRANITRMLNLGLPVIVRTNVGAHNIEAVPRLAEFYQGEGWFEFPKFKAFLTHTYDRHHDFQSPFTLSEQEAVSRFLQFRDDHPPVRRLQGIKFGPSLENILKAFALREATDVTCENFQVEIKPTLSYCYTTRGNEYVFTGAPNYSIYPCAECTGLTRFRLGRYLPEIQMDPDGTALWGKDPDFFAQRSLDVLEPCRTCRAATFCGGYCALEAISQHGTAKRPYCKGTDRTIADFLERESPRLYRRASILLDKTQNLTL